jgi:sec-independent protein translocase protein TatB
MFGIGGQELILLMLIGLIVLGPERLPRIANQMGSWLGQARRMTRVMKRQLEEELDLDKAPTIKPPPVSREPSFKPAATPPVESAEPDYTLPREDDDYSAAHGEDEVGTGVDKDEDRGEADLAASEAEREAVETAAKESPASDEEPNNDKQTS